MNQQEFTRFLLKSALCLMGCDGEIHPSEIDELGTINEHSSYFDSIDFAGELEELRREIEQEGKLYIYRYYRELESRDLELTEENELILLEVLLRITYADEKVDENELIFLGMIRPRLKVSDRKILAYFDDSKAEILLEQDRRSKITDIDDIRQELPGVTGVSLSETIQVDTPELKIDDKKL